MLKQYRSKIIVSSIIVLIPMLFGLIMWKNLPDAMTTHWGADGIADGFGGKVFAVLVMPAIMLVLHFVCMLFTLLDKKQQGQNPKVLGMVFWIIPMVSVFTSGIMYYSALNMELNIALFLSVVLGLMFIFMGNYMPKIKPNRTIGVRLYWTLSNEENWNRTHRFAGKLWLIGGVVVLFSMFLPLKLMIPAIALVIVLIALLPFAYSYWIYRQHQAQGIVYGAPNKTRGEQAASKISAVMVAVILIGVAFLMFTGDVKVKFEDSSFTINASYWTDLKLNYDQVDSIEYRESFDKGVRRTGVGSGKLSVGVFQNNEFGTYTLYARAGAEEYIVLRSGERILAIGLEKSEDTKALYDTMLSKTGK